MTKTAERDETDRTPIDPAGIEPGQTGQRNATPRGRSEAAIRLRIIDAILERRLPPGEKLTEDRLATLFAVSRTVVRQALSRLAQDGIVEHHPNRGAFVAAPSRAEALHVMNARAVVEPEVARLAACGCSPAMSRRLRRHLEAEDVARATGDQAALVRLTGTFHVLLAQASGNPVFVRLLTELQALSALAILLYARGGHTSCPPHEHAAILAAVEAGDAPAAAQHMRSHLAHVVADMDLTEAGLATAEGRDLAQALGLADAPRRRSGGPASGGSSGRMRRVKARVPG